MYFQRNTKEIDAVISYSVHVNILEKKIIKLAPFN